MNKDCKTFDLNERRPQVLLLGNGLTYDAGISWYELIRKVARKDVDVNKYEKERVNERFTGYYVPNTVLTLATSETDDSNRHKQYGKAFDQIIYQGNDYISQLVELPFDAILTANYTYEIEYSLFPRYIDLSAQGKRKYAYQTCDKSEGRYLLRTYNRLDKNKPDIWHIHGELRRPSSIILSHDEYARMIHQILAYNKDRGSDYEKKKNELRFDSWVDYYLMGDVYVLGLSLDFSDFDLWWLLGRRLREKAECGKFIFYEPVEEKNKYKQLALIDSGVDVRTCNKNICQGDQYGCFYEEAIRDMKEQITNR